MNTRNTSKRPNRFTRVNERKEKSTYMARQAADIREKYSSMNNLPKPRQHLGYIEEYYHAGSSASQFGQYLGHRKVTEAVQPCGTENRQIVTLQEKTSLQRSWSKVNTLPKGARVILIVWPLQGREV